MEYVVWNNEFGDFDMERCSPRGTVKSRMAGEERTSESNNDEDKYEGGRVPLEDLVKLAYKLSSFHPVAL